MIKVLNIKLYKKKIIIFNNKNIIVEYYLKKLFKR